jgi:hypothetical protein
MGTPYKGKTSDFAATVRLDKIMSYFMSNTAAVVVP